MGLAVEAVLASSPSGGPGVSTSVAVAERSDQHQGRDREQAVSASWGPVRLQRGFGVL